MGLFRSLFGRSSKPDLPPGPAPPAAEPAGAPEMIQVFDGYGRPLQVARADWWDSVLSGALEQAKDDPGRLYTVVLDALHNGFAAEAVPYAEHLHQTDPLRIRGATLLSIAYREAGRAPDAEQVLADALATEGRDPTLLANLAQLRRDPAEAEALLWEAIGQDPNADAAFSALLALRREQGGTAAEQEALRRIAEQPGSWRAQLWHARADLDRGDLGAAVGRYENLLAGLAPPVPTDLLMQLSGDLGQRGHVAEAVRLAGPAFDAAQHGLLVGNNLVKAHLALGKIEAARAILEALYAQQRPDWQDGLQFWETELAKAGVEARAGAAGEMPGFTVLVLEGAVWARAGSPFEALLPAKAPDAVQVAVIGAAAVMPPEAQRAGLQLSDGPGRLSRAAPLALAERLHLTTDAAAATLVPWAEGHGFALFGGEMDDADLGSLAGNERPYVAAVTVDAAQEPWTLRLRLVRTADGVRLGEARAEVEPNNPAPAVAQLADALVDLVARHVGVQATPPPAWYRVPDGADGSDLLLRLEQQLAVLCAQTDGLGGGLSGEREIVDGTLRLCLQRPDDVLPRLVLAQTLRLMRRARPAVPPEFEDKVLLLLRQHPLASETGRLADAALAEAAGI